MPRGAGFHRAEPNTLLERERERERERAGTATPDNLHFGLPSPISLTVLNTLYTHIFFFTRFGPTKVKRYENFIKTKTCHKDKISLQKQAMRAK